MRMLLVFVALFAVTGVAYAETKTGCSDKAYSVFQGCVEVFREFQEMNKESDLYELWEQKIILQRAEECLAFQRRNESRYQACVDRFIDETVEQVVEKTIQDMDPEERKELEKSGPVTLPPHEGSERPLQFATKLEARRYVMERIVRGTLEGAMKEMQQKQ